jgi:uncharacterized DUF497 family protein
VRFKWNPLKNQLLYSKRKLSFTAVISVFEQNYHLSQKCDDPEQWRAIGWHNGKLVTLIFEVREDRDGPYYWLITAWLSTRFEERLFHEK